MSKMDNAMVSRYDLQLEKVQESLKGYDRPWVNLLQTWRDELRTVSDQEILRKHAARTARSMGGMESLGEVVGGLKNDAASRLLEELYAICKLILSS
jgi:hypothetical protein